MKRGKPQIVGDTLEDRVWYLWRGGADTVAIARRLDIPEHQAERIVHARADQTAASPHNREN
jgi:plasmid maintenance system antidote protein VapI